jgi:hypothetical protein
MSKSGLINLYLEEKKSNDIWGRVNKAIMHKRGYAGKLKARKARRAGKAERPEKANAYFA